MKSDFVIALTQLAAERSLPREIVISAIEAALASAYRKDAVADGKNISVKLDPVSGDVTVNTLKTVVERVEDPVTEIDFAAARVINPGARLHEVITTESIPHSAGRIAAQTAKQVVLQRLREAERDLLFREFTDKVGEVFSVTVQRLEARHIVVDMGGRGEAILPQHEQMPTERYRQGQRFKALLRSVDRTIRGTELIVSRADRDLLRRLFEMEVPEIYNGAVEMVSVARDVGSREIGARSKVAVRARQDGIDPVGSCVGLRGVRIKNIVDELQGEKIDVLEWDKDITQFIANALNPARVIRVELEEHTQTAMAVVQDRHLSLAIGKEGQNARLAAKLTGWSVDIKSFQEAEAIAMERARMDAEMARAAALEAARIAAEREREQAAERVAAGEPLPADETILAPAADLRTQAEIEAEEAALMAELEREQAEAERRRIEREREQAELLAALEAEEAERIRREEEEAAARAEAEESEEATSLRDLPEDVWSIPAAPGQADAGGIRFAEDIVGLRGGVTARRARRAGVIDPNAPPTATAPPRGRGRRRGRGGGPRRRR